ncbi:SigE family RNA polymerase sigma factor [Nocardioides sp. 503]|uniref:SigE family RNA polymerase sigma factor n=1 Tax=Nocardioides sp. 503 TaxID=2508326 RepID=UPI00106F480B|nr:SigE family RNA polymerase sigma factor [Nocardioides sp. 503]
MTSDKQYDQEFTAWAVGAERQLLRSAVLLTGDLHRAQDRVQEAMVKVAMRWPRLRGGQPTAYARTIVVRDTISWWRRRRREVNVDPTPVLDREPVSGVSTDAEAGLVVRRALARLTPAQRSVVVLRYFDDLTERETAQVLGITVGTVKSQSAAALARLRNGAPELLVQRTAALSPDGRRVAAAGISGLFWRELDGGAWQRVDVPHSVTGEGIEVTWLPGSSSLVLRSHLPGVLVDLGTGRQRSLPELTGYVAWGADPQGFLTYVSREGELVSQEPAGGLRRVIINLLEGLHHPVLSATSLVAARGNRVISSPPAVDDRDGLIALDRDTLAARRYLPVRDASSYYVGQALTPRAWLDDDTVLFSVLPRGTSEEHLVTWDVESGALRRATSWPATYDASFATELLRL